MIRHVAVFKWKPGFPDKDLNEWMDRLRALPEQIDELSSLTVGTDVLHGGRSWDAAVVADVDQPRGPHHLQPEPRTPSDPQNLRTQHRPTHPSRFRDLVRITGLR